MFDIKGLRTFAMSAKNLNQAVEFYTQVLGGEITPGLLLLIDVVEKTK